MKNFKWPVAVLAFILTLALSVGAVTFRQRQLVNEPLVKRLSEYEGVEKVELWQKGNLQVISIELDYVQDFSVLYSELKEETDRLLGPKFYRLMLVDQRNETLEAAFLAVHLALYEGEQRGNFTEMSDRVAAILRDYQLQDYRLVVDNTNIYLQIRSGENYLYAVIERVSRGEDGERV